MLETFNQLAFNAFPNTAIAVIGASPQAVRIDEAGRLRGIRVITCSFLVEDCHSLDMNELLEERNG